MKNPEAYQSIRNEVDEVCGSEPVAFEHLSKLKYIDAALKETLRLQPTAPAFTVASDEDLVVQGRDGKYEIPAGAPCAMILHVLHRDVSVWGPDVEEFKYVYISIFRVNTQKGKVHANLIRLDPFPGLNECLTVDSRRCHQIHGNHSATVCELASVDRLLGKSLSWSLLQSSSTSTSVPPTTIIRWRSSQR